MVDPHGPKSPEPLTREECLDILQNKSKVGRVGFIDGDRPMMLPVNYIADRESVTFCASSGSKLSELGKGEKVAFEVDASRSLEHEGWSVLIQGTAHQVTDEDELIRLRRGPLHSWGSQAGDHWLRISIEEITGRRVSEE